jgi:hypothetical protein
MLRLAPSRRVRSHGGGEAVAHDLNRSQDKTRKHFPRTYTLMLAKHSKRTCATGRIVGDSRTKSKNVEQG